MIVSGLAIGEAARYAGDWLRGKPPASRHEGFSSPLLLRFVVDDLKAYCMEATAGCGKAVEPRAWRLAVERDRGRRRDPCLANSLAGERG